MEVLQAELAALREKSDKVEKLEREVAMAHHHVTHLEFLAQEYVDKLNQVTRVNERLKVELEAKGRGLQTGNTEKKASAMKNKTERLLLRAVREEACLVLV